jgi:hypothetical protein
VRLALALSLFAAAGCTRVALPPPSGAGVRTPVAALLRAASVVADTAPPVGAPCVVGAVVGASLRQAADALGGLVVPGVEVDVSRCGVAEPADVPAAADLAVAAVLAVVAVASDDCVTAAVTTSLGLVAEAVLDAARTGSGVVSVPPVPLAACLEAP